MFKKIIAALLVVTLTVTVSVAGTVAYLTSTAEDANVMTLGNVKIEQIEQERDENGELQDFTQAKPAYPAVGEIAWADTGVDVNGTEYKVFADGLENVVDKIVTVKNTGLSDAYVRTLIAIEAPEGFNDNLVHVNVNADEKIVQTGWEYIQVNGVRYVYTSFTYTEALEPDEISEPSLMQVFLDSTANNEDCALLGDTWDILVLSQAVQTQGFEDADTALDTGFGDPEADNADGTMKNVEEWFSEVQTPILVTDVQELKDAMLIRGANIVLANDIVVDAETPLQWGKYMFVANGGEVTINLNGKNIIVAEDASLQTNALFTTANGGTLNITGTGTVEVKNGKSGIFHAMNRNDQINVYGGTYISNSNNGSDALAIIYTNSGNVDIYGGKFCPLDGIECANAEDRQGDRLSIVFHEGALLKNDKYYAGSDATRIQLEEGCSLKQVTIDGETWYQVAK